jgi:hypothetical protein
VRRQAAALAEAFASGSFGYAVSIKDPYAWIVSLARYLRWPTRSGVLSPSCADKLRNACRGFNDRYRAWLALTESPRHRVVIVRHEDLVRDAEAVLACIDGAFSVRRAEPFRAVSGVVGPAAWDDTAMSVRGYRFDPGPYLRGDYLASLAPQHREILGDTIDWKLMERFGYRPLSD